MQNGEQSVMIVAASLILDNFIKLFTKHLFKDMINANEVNLTSHNEYSSQFFVFCANSLYAVKYLLSIKRRWLIQNIY